MMSKRIYYLVLAVLFFPLSPSVQAGLIKWDYEATIDTTGSDPLGIKGDNLSINLVFDTNDVWQSTYNDARLWVPTASAEATINGHMVTLNSSTPAAYFDGTDLYIAEGVGIGSFMDIIVDGILTQMVSYGGTAPTKVPSAGDNLQIDHLTVSTDIFYGLVFKDTTSGDQFIYTFEDPSISVTAVSEPATLSLLSLGLAGLGFTRGRMKA